MTASFRFAVIAAVIFVAMEALFSLDSIDCLQTKEEIRSYLMHHPESINQKITWGKYKDVYLSYLLCSGKLGTPEESSVVLEKVIDVIDLSQLDESNLWGEVGCFQEGTVGSGNNVLKTAVAGACPIAEGGHQGIGGSYLFYWMRSKVQTRG